MGDVLTPNLGLIKPDVGGSDDMWGEKLNANFDKIDTAIAAGGGGDVTQVYVDAQDALRVLKAGDAMTGFLTLHADPITAFQAATKQYVDAHSGGGGGGIPEAPNDGTVYGRRNLAWTRAVAVAGDVMVGDLTIRKAFPTLWLDKPAAGAGEVSIYGTAATIAQWGLILGTGANNNFELRRHNAAGAYMTSPLVVDRLTGKTFITGNTGPALDVSVAPGTNTNFVATFRGDPTLNSACIEVKGTYSAYFGSIAGYPGMFKDAGVNGAYWYDTNNSFMGVAGHIAVCWPNGYINFAINSGGASGATGWGFRDNAGIVEAKHSGGAWAPVGDVTGPAAAVADRIAVFNGATGKLIKDGGITIAGLSAYVPSGNIAANTLAGAIAELDAEKVAKAGDTMTGHLTLPAGPAAANATRKDYVDAAAALKLSKAGDTMTGDLQFNAGFATTGITPASNPGLGNTTFGFNMRQDGYGPIIFYNRNNYGGIYIGQNIDGTLLSWTRSGATVGAIGVTTTSTSYGTSSDERLKEDLKSFDAGNIIDDTNVYNFAWKATGERTYGVIAQQAIDIYPTAVTHDEETDWWGVDYSKYVPVILQELKALRARVAELELKAGIKPPAIAPKSMSKKTKKVKKAKSKRGIRHG